MSKKNDNKKRAALTLGAGALAGAAIIGGTLAYLTDEEQATNTFTVGRVTVDLEEKNWPGNGSDKVTSIVPNEEIPKDPQTLNSGKNDAIIYMAVDVPMAKVVVADEDGKIDDAIYPLLKSNDPNYVAGEAKREAKNTELFKFSEVAYTKGAPQVVADGIQPYNSIDSNWKPIQTSDSFLVGTLNTGLDADGTEKDSAASYGANKAAVNDYVTYIRIVRDGSGNKLMDETGKNYKLEVIKPDSAEVAAAALEAAKDRLYAEAYDAAYSEAYGTTPDEAAAHAAGVAAGEAAANSATSASVTDEDKAAGAASIADYARRVFGYNKVVAPTEETDPLFETVKLANVQEGHIDEEKLDMNLYTYAIQADNISATYTPEGGSPTALTSEDFKANGDISEPVLKGVYDVYVNQSGDQIAADADATKAVTLGENQKTSTMNISMELDDTHLELHSGKAADAKTTGVVTLNYVGNGTAPTATVASDNTDVATVTYDSATGAVTVTAVKAGTAVITATATNPDNNEPAEAKVTITVQDMAPATASPTPTPTPEP